MQQHENNYQHFFASPRENNEISLNVEVMTSEAQLKIED